MADINMRLAPWVTPNYAHLEQPPQRRNEGLKELPAIHIADLTDEAFNSLVEEWISTIYNKASKRNPWSRT